MKKLILFMSAVLLMTAVSFSQKKLVLLKTSNNQTFNYGETALLTTTDSTLTTIDSVLISANEGGVIEVMVVGFNDSLNSAVTGVKIARYVKGDGTLTLGSATNSLTSSTDASLGTATWTLSASGNNIIVQVKGKLGVTVKWQCNIRKLYRTGT